MTQWSRADLEQIHRACTRHRERVTHSALCGCFYCLAVFPPAEITDWVDGPEGDDDLQQGVTALCARCGIDAVLPDDIPGAPITGELLEAMHAHWFERTVRL
jgi:hypothetical protein